MPSGERPRTPSSSENRAAPTAGAHAQRRVEPIQPGDRPRCERSRWRTRRSPPTGMASAARLGRCDRGEAVHHPAETGGIQIGAADCARLLVISTWRQPGRWPGDAMSVRRRRRPAHGRGRRPSAWPTARHRRTRFVIAAYIASSPEQRHDARNRCPSARGSRHFVDASIWTPAQLPARTNKETGYSPLSSRSRPMEC